MRSIKWYVSLQNKPKVYFNRWNFFKDLIKHSDQSRPFYEFGVWRGEAFKYLIKFFKKGYGFDTFEGLPEKWHETDSGTYSGDGRVPDIKGGEFFVGNVESTRLETIAEDKERFSFFPWHIKMKKEPRIVNTSQASKIKDNHDVLFCPEISKFDFSGLQKHFKFYCEIN